MRALNASLRLNEKGLNSKQVSLKMHWKLKGLCLDLCGICLAKIPLDISLALMKYHIKPLGVTKIQSFPQDLYEYDLFLYP